MAKSGQDVGPGAGFFVFPILIALALAFIGYAILQGAPQHLQLITVSASGSASAVPAQAQISLFLNSTGSTAAASVSDLSVVTGNLYPALMPFVDDNMSYIFTQSYTVYVPPTCYNSTVYYPQERCIPRGAPIYYVASESVLITLPNASNVNRAISSLSQISGLSISGVSSRLSPEQQTALMQQALAAALTNATVQATTLSQGEQIEIHNITVQNGYITYPFTSTSVFTTPGAVLNQTFFSGRATVTKSIYVVFSTH